MKKIDFTLLMLILLCTDIQAQDFKNNQNDVSVHFNIAMVESAISRLSNTAYSGVYDNNGTVCPKPRVTATMGNFSIGMSGDVEGYDGKTSIVTQGRIELEARLTGNLCGSWRVGTRCSIATDFIDLTKPGLIGGLCLLRLGPLPEFPFFVGAEIEPVVKEPPLFPIKLRDSDAVKMEFGSFEDGQWSSAQNRHEKVISYWANFGLTTTQEVPAQGLIKGDKLSMNASIGSRFYDITTNIRTYREHYLFAGDFEIERDLFQVQIDQSLFLKKDIEGNTSGLLGEIFPIRVTGHIGGANVDVILEGADVKYGTLEGQKVIVIGAKVVSVSTGALIEKAEALVTLSQPSMEEDELVTYIERFDLNMETQCFLLSTCIHGSLLEYFDSRRLVISKFAGKVELEVPNCIDMENSRWNPDGNMCPRGTVGRQDTQDKSTRITPIFSDAKIQIDEYALKVTVPARIEHYNPPRGSLREFKTLPESIRNISKGISIPDDELSQGIDTSIRQYIPKQPISSPLKQVENRYRDHLFGYGKLFKDSSDQHFVEIRWSNGTRADVKFTARLITYDIAGNEVDRLDIRKTIGWSTGSAVEEALEFTAPSPNDGKFVVEWLAAESHDWELKIPIVKWEF